MQVRVFKEEDCNKIRDLILSILTKEYPFDKSAYSDSDLYDLNGTYSGPRDNFFVLDDNGEIIGTVGVKEDTKESALLRRLFVDPAHRRKGYGELLMNEALRFCQDKGYNHVVFRTTSRMIHAIELCKKKGFKKIEEIDLQGFQIYKFVRDLT